MNADAIQNQNFITEFPKLPDQDDFLIYLQNNNYSDLTVINYARDLSIFALFLRQSKISFNDISKKTITLYKGFLQDGLQLDALRQFRVEMFNKYHENVGISSLNRIARSKASKTGGKEKDESVVVSDDLKIPDNGGISSRDDSEVSSQQLFLRNVYRKVFATLGKQIAHPTGREVEGLSAKSINRMLSALRSYLKFRIEFDLDIPIPPTAVTMVRMERKKSQVADLEDLIRLIESPMHLEKDVKIATRNRAIFEVLFATGMRISELVNLDLEDINKEGRLFIMGKGRKQRFVYLTPRALYWVNEYLKFRFDYGFNSEEIKDKELRGLLKLYRKDQKKRYQDRGNWSKCEHIIDNTVSDESNPNNVSNSLPYIDLLESMRLSGVLSNFTSPALFIPFHGRMKNKSGVRLSKNFIQEKIAEYRRRLGIRIPTTAHSLRHGFATYLAENGASPVALQVLLGHESLNTTTRYVHASDKFAKKVHREKHPLKR